MTTESIMTTNLVTANENDTVIQTLIRMRKNRLHNIPVLDDSGNFIGLFTLRRITRSLLPKASQIDEKRWRFNLNFMPDNSDEMTCKLLELGKRPVSEVLEKKSKLRFCSPETTVPELLQLLSENATSLPVLVLQGKKQKLAGMVSNWDVLTKLAYSMLNNTQPGSGGIGRSGSTSSQKNQFS